MSFDSTLTAYEDADFLRSDDCRGIRLELEYFKPELQMRRKRIAHTVVIFGSARLRSPEEAQARLREIEDQLTVSPDDPQLLKAAKAAEAMLKNSRYYTMAREFADMVTRYDETHDGGGNFVVTTGGGPGIMEAGNRGAAEAGGSSIGLNIQLPFEQHPNRYITEDLSFRFHYFSIRKMHFMKRARALGCFPGGFGTMDELFEAMTLVQTGVVSPMPVLLFGRDFWEKLINWQLFIDDAVISPDDLKLFHYCDSAEEGWQIIRDFYHLP